MITHSSMSLTYSTLDENWIDDIIIVLYDPISVAYQSMKGSTAFTFVILITLIVLLLSYSKVYCPINTYIFLTLWY